MKKQKITQIILLLIVLILAVASVFIVYFMKSKSPAKVEEIGGITMLSDRTTCEVFQEVPALIEEGVKIGEPVQYGNGVYMIDMNGTTMEHYLDYQKLLTETGFVKHSDNGEDGMEGYVYTSTYTKENLVLTVSHSVNIEKTYVAEAFDMPISEHLIYKDEYMEGASADAKTKVHMLELNNNGASFVIELKNGHFVLHDGGIDSDAPYLLDYLEGLTPGDAKPVIEGWFISHPHSDHYGALQKIMSKTEYTNRIYVDGFYFVEPSAEVVNAFMANSSNNSGLNLSVWYCVNAAKSFKREDGSACELYRPQLGQRYYFADITIDVAFTSDLISDNAITSDINDLSCWLMHTIDGQRFLIAGDAGSAGTQISMKHYDESYFVMDIFAVLHHGINVYDYFTDYCTIDTLLYPNWRVGSLWQDGSTYAAEEENEHLQASVKEAYSHGEGTVVLTFPYEVGEAEIMEPCDWRYNYGRPDRTIFDN